jgi:hypothetical protein
MDISHFARPALEIWNDDSRITFGHPFRTSLFLGFLPHFVSTRSLTYVLTLGIKHDFHTRVAGDGLTSFKRRPFAAL